MATVASGEAILKSLPDKVEELREAVVVLTQAADKMYEGNEKKERESETASSHSK